MVVNYGKNVGSVRPNLIRWGRERDRGGCTHPNPRAAPISFTEGKVAPTSGGSWGRGGRSGPALLGSESGPDLCPRPFSTNMNKLSNGALQRMSVQRSERQRDVSPTQTGE